MISNHLLSRIGTCSYSIYIVHFALLDVVRVIVKNSSIRHSQSEVSLLLLIVIPVTLGSYLSAMFTRRLVEIPGIKVGHKLSSLLLPQRSANYVEGQGVRLGDARSFCCFCLTGRGRRVDQWTDCLSADRPSRRHQFEVAYAARVLGSDRLTVTIGTMVGGASG